MPYRALVKLLKAHGCVCTRTEGSHERWETPDGKCRTSLVHVQEIAPGTLRNIRDDLAPCLGKDWLA